MKNIRKDNEVFVVIENGKANIYMRSNKNNQLSPNNYKKLDEKKVKSKHSKKGNTMKTKKIFVFVLSLIFTLLSNGENIGAQTQNNREDGNSYYVPNALEDISTITNYDKVIEPRIKTFFKIDEIIMLLTHTQLEAAINSSDELDKIFQKDGWKYKDDFKVYYFITPNSVLPWKVIYHKKRNSFHFLKMTRDNFDGGILSKDTTQMTAFLKNEIPQIIDDYKTLEIQLEIMNDEKDEIKEKEKKSNNNIYIIPQKKPKTDKEIIELAKKLIITDNLVILLSPNQLNKKKELKKIIPENLKIFFAQTSQNTLWRIIYDKKENQISCGIITTLTKKGLKNDLTNILDILQSEIEQGIDFNKSIGMLKEKNIEK